MKATFQLGLFVVLLLASGQRSVIGQSQIAYNGLDDFGSGAVQTFVAEQTGHYVGVSLVLFGHGAANDVTLFVRSLNPGGSLEPMILATGFVPASGISTSTPAWHYIAFASPLNISAGESYGLVLNQFGSGPAGYIDYGAYLGDPYPNGRMFYEWTPGRPLSPILDERDLAFQNVVLVPEPGAMALVLLSSGVALGICRRSANSLPFLQRSLRGPPIQHL